MASMQNQPEESTAILIPPSPNTPLLGGGPRRRSRSKAAVAAMAVSAILAAAVLLATVPRSIGGKGKTDDTLSSPHLPNATAVLSAGPAVARGFREGVSNKSFGPPPGDDGPFTWTEEMLSWQRSSFHFQPKKNWMNGPLFYKGWYHLFYQYNPESAIWGNIVWGHAVSRDLIHWDHLPIAMVPDHWYDANGVWTGSATILHDGQIVMLYTGATYDLVQVQNLAYPADPSDPLLVKWVKYEGNPVLVPPPGIGSRDFRDPTTAWYTMDDGKWHIMIGSKLNKTGITMIFDTEDFRSFKLVNGLAHGVSGTGMWECVDFYPVSTTGENGLDSSYNGPDMKHVLKTSLDDDRNDYYALGTYDEGAQKWRPDDPGLDAGIGLRYDYGTYYASKSFYDQEKKRRVNWGWIYEIDSVTSDLQKGWASLQAIPRTILFDNKTGTNLRQWPVEEVDLLRSHRSKYQKVELKPGSVVELDVGYANELDIVAEFEVDEEALEKAESNHVPYSCRAAGGGAALRGALGPFGLLVLANHQYSEQTPIYFYIAKGAKGKFKTFFCADHLRSSLATDVRKTTYGSTVPVLDGERLSMRILVDHSIVESFAQGGRTCITSRVYPTRAIGSAAKLYLFNNATEAAVTASLEIWQMAAGKDDSAAHKPKWRTSSSAAAILLVFMIFFL
ncbi:unnamed protein product [Cuscuta campestris]|uniref:beta-fructofuranosidase n=1 Tax=Cuscuta campestris TaxID=132261 RepID=A0A484LFL8_9ASTE|nr:unnamed protein product [Cuscuta campestris]